MDGTYFNTIHSNGRSEQYREYGFGVHSSLFVAYATAIHCNVAVAIHSTVINTVFNTIALHCSTISTRTVSYPSLLQHILTKC